MNKLKIKLLHEKAILPTYATTGSSGMDLYSVSNYIIAQNEIKIIDCGIALEIPSGFEGQIRSRSGMAAKNGVIVLNSPGTIDSDYRGEIKIILKNLGHEDFSITCGMRVAQLVILKYEKMQITQMELLEDTKRGDGGFGSTGA